MTRPRLLDLFCCAGGAAMGYHRAGFDVVGVDVKRQPNYPFKFIKTDALDILDDRHFLRTFDAIHASPPCQGYTTMSNRHRGKGGRADSHPKLINQTFLKLGSAGVPWVIENVPGARSQMRNPIRLSGGMFGLAVNRPRLFDSSETLSTPLPARVADPVGVYGALDGRRLWTRADGTEQHAARTLEEAQDAMGIDWMTWPELTEAIPPAYTEYIGRQLMNALEVAA